DQLAAQICPLHHSTQRFTEIWRNGVAVMEAIFGYSEFCFRIEHHEVGVAVFGDRTLAVAESGEMRRLLCHPACDVGEREAAPRSLGPNERQRHREAGDAAPGRLKCTQLHVGRTWRMICDDHVEDAVAQGLPELLAIRAGADWGGALELRGSIGDVFSGKMQVVWAGFAGDGQ